MSPQTKVNRVEADLREWKAREEHLAKLFSASPTFSTALLKERLKFYDYLFLKFKNRANIEERLILQILKKEKKGMLVTLYPNLVIRLLKAVVHYTVRRSLEKSNYEKQVLANHKDLENQLKQIGFKDVFKKVRDLIEKGEPKFSIPVSYYINENERIQYNLDFNNTDGGKYKFEGYQAILKNVQKPNEERSHYFKINSETNFSLKEVYNLLEGRTVCKDQKWFQFDLNEKDTFGNYRIKEFTKEYGYDLEKVLQNLPLKDCSESAVQRLIDVLNEGCRESVLFIKDRSEQKYFIEANPQFRSVNIFDANQRKVSLKSALIIRTAVNENKKAQDKRVNNSKPKSKGVRIK